MRNMKIATCLLTITSLVLSACGGGGNDIEKAKSLATTEHLKRYTEAISHDSCQGRKPFSEGADRADVRVRSGAAPCFCQRRLAGNGKNFIFV